MLQIYAHQNPHIGYRQGMHEIASYLLLVIEMDLFDLESQQREPDPLLDPNYIAHDTYCMFLAVMSQLGPAYDVKMNQGAESPMEQMAQSILAKIRDTANDKNLHRHLVNLNCPPELYCTRWVRLMFSREVAGWKNVLLLWDIFFDLVAKCSLTSMARSRYTRPGVTPALKLGGFSLMLVMEAASASMILLQRSALLSHQDGVDADSIHRLMNISPLKNILPLTATLLSMMRRIQLQQDQLELPSSKRRSYTLSELAQNAFSTGGQSILNILNGSTANINAMASEEASHIPTSPASSEVKHDVRSGTETVSNPSVAMCDKAAKLKIMARKLNDATHTLRRFLMELEKTSTGGSGSQVPPTVWAALEEIGCIQTDMIMYPDE
jgi:TBC1 domain family protein 5